MVLLILFCPPPPLSMRVGWFSGCFFILVCVGLHHQRVVFVCVFFFLVVKRRSCENSAIRDLFNIIVYIGTKVVW